MRDEPRIRALAHQQFGMRAGFDYPDVFDDKNGVRIVDRRVPMRDDDRRALCHERFERVANLLLVDCVEMRGRLVENQHRRTFQERAGYGHPLALTARNGRNRPERP